VTRHRAILRKLHLGSNKSLGPCLSTRHPRRTVDGRYHRHEAKHVAHIDIPVEEMTWVGKHCLFTICEQRLVARKPCEHRQDNKFEFERINTQTQDQGFGDRSLKDTGLQGEVESVLARELTQWFNPMVK